MSSRFEEELIMHCAPTLAGHKCGSLFSYHVSGKSDSSGISGCVRALMARGIRIALLGKCNAGWLIYVYRPSMLNTRLCMPEVRDFMLSMGYDLSGGWLEQLRVHLHSGDGFPHEIGIFLDYPLCDVRGFIEHGGADYCCCGVWKCYCNADSARRIFALYRKCRDVYIACYRRGLSISRLTVAA